MKPLGIFVGIVVVGLSVIFVGLRLTDHSASADPLPTPLTHAQFVRAGNAVCDRYYRDDPTIFRNPKTVKAFARDFRIAVPFVDQMEAGLRALVPPPGDAGTYRRLLRGLGLQNHAVHAMLHAFETGQIRQGVLIARSTARLDLHLNSLANKVGLNVCGLSDHQVAARYGKTGGAAVPATSKAASAPVTHSRSAGKRGATPAPRFVGSYQTLVRVLVDTTKPGLPTGYTAVRNWRFVRHCAGTCTTTLLRPSIKPGSALVFLYRLHVITGGGYRGKLNVGDICYGRTTDGRPKILPTGSVVDRVVITIRPTRTSAGKVVAFSGTMVLRLKVSPWAHAHGCVAHGYQKSSVKSPA